VSSRGSACSARLALIDYFGIEDGPANGIYGVGIDYFLYDPDDCHGYAYESYRLSYGTYGVVINADPYRFGDIPPHVCGVPIRIETHRKSPPTACGATEKIAGKLNAK
jgi:hypothetical protein